ncbi:MAG: branched-chain amino acid aminotransferase [SAR202 cluster bacterium]|nr:branched-chain amino acid aminotransferase [SAR202 cluster bacterium]
MAGIPDTYAYFNGEWKPRSQCKIDLLDRGFYVGDAVFDIARTFNGKSFKMKEHVERLYRSLKHVRIDPGLSLQEMIDLSEESVSRNEKFRPEVGDWHVWQAVTRGTGGWRAPVSPPTVIIQCVPVPFRAYSKLYKTGGHLVVTKTRSYNADQLDPKVKHYSRLNFNLADLEAQDVDPEGWPVMLDSKGNLTEGTGYNVFIVTNGVIRTAGDSSLLQGVSRGAVFEVAEQLGIPVAQEELQPYDLYTADEAFIANTPTCILPMTKADNRAVGDGKPGPIVQQILAAWSERVGLDIVDQAVRFGGK